MNLDTQAPPWLDRYAQITLENRNRLQSLKELIARLREARIEAIPLKGVDLLLRAYQDLGQRPMVDIDLLIREKDRVSFTELLRLMHFQERYAQTSLNASFMEEALTFDSADRMSSVDVIWGFWYSPDMTSVWQRRVIRQTSLGELPLLHPEDALIYLVTYVVAHRGYFSEVFIQDLAVFLEREGDPIDWQSWVHQVRSLQLSEPIYHGLSYAQSRGVTVIPEQVIRALAPQTLAERIVFAYYQRAVTDSEIPYGRYLFPFITAPGWKSRIRLLRQAVFPSRRLVELRLGHSVSLSTLVLRAFIRPFWILLRAGYFVRREITFYRRNRKTPSPG